MELPNVTGMALFADGGFLASKPYAAGGSYINRMSDYCRHCKYKVREKNGPEARPFNYLFWNFLIRNRDKLRSFQRISMLNRNIDAMSDAKRSAIHADAHKFLNEIQ